MTLQVRATKGKTVRRIAFMGSPEFAVVALRALHEAGADVALVVTQPDRPAGRGQALRPPAVKEFAQSVGLPVLQPTKVRDGNLSKQLLDLNIDIAVVAAYGRILGRDVLDAPRLGCVNLHASLLPRWRGASPIARAIAAGDAESGVCLMRMEEGLDTGPVLARVVVPIGEMDTTATLEVKLAAAGGQLLIAHLDDLFAQRLTAQPQDETLRTLAPPLEKAEGRIDWTLPAAVVHAHVRAMQPWPGAVTVVGNEAWRVFADGLQLDDRHGEPGTIAALQGDTVWVHCGQGTLGIAQIQRPSKRQMTAGEVLRGARLGTGARLS